MSKLNPDNIFQGFLNCTDNVFSDRGKFEPIFLRKSRFFAEFFSARKQVASLASFTNAIAGSNRSFRFCSNDSSFPFKAAFSLIRICSLETYTTSPICALRDAYQEANPSSLRIESSRSLPLRSACRFVSVRSECLSEPLKIFLKPVG